MKIWYSTPYSSNKDIADAYNDFCALVPNDEDWIVLRDADSTMLTPDWGTLIESSLKNNGNEYGLIGCYTNRLKKTHQLHNRQLSHDHDMTNHYKIALDYAKRPATINDNGRLLIAGLFMAFQKKTWKKVGGFRGFAFDTNFANDMHKHGLKIGLMNNIYIYHWYRGWNNETPGTDNKHLK
jgi:hypothetical protein